MERQSTRDPFSGEQRGKYAQMPRSRRRKGKKLAPEPAEPPGNDLNFAHGRDQQQFKQAVSRSRAEAGRGAQLPGLPIRSQANHALNIAVVVQKFLSPKPRHKGSTMTASQPHVTAGPSTSFVQASRWGCAPVSPCPPLKKKPRPWVCRMFAETKSAAWDGGRSCHERRPRSRRNRLPRQGSNEIAVTSTMTTSSWLGDMTRPVHGARPSDVRNKVKALTTANSEYRGSQPCATVRY